MPVFLGVSLIIGSISALSAAEPIAREIVVKQGAVEQRYIVAPDQLYVKKKGVSEGYVSITAQTSVAGLTSQAALQQTKPEDEIYLVLLDARDPQDVSKRTVLFKSVLVELAPDVDDQALAAQVGAVSKGRLSFAPSYCVFQTTSMDGALTARDVLKAKPGVINAEVEVSRNLITYLAPNDPLFSQQWHLRNTGQNGALPGIDANVSSVWDTYRGSGVWLLIVDDSLEETHPDLQANVNSTIAWDYRDGDSNPGPVGSDAHGTSVAGIAAARGDNNLGVAGAAFEATISGVRLIGGPLADTTIAAALNHSNSVVHVSNNSWGPANEQVILQNSAVMDAALSNITAGRNGLGKIMLFAAGNGGPVSNVNFNNLANSIYTIAVAALNDLGLRASYSTPGAALIVAAPSGRDSTRPQGSTTTDVTGNGGYNPGPGEVADTDYTQLFNGTSSATPLVSGVVALLLEANPNLGWRDVQEILIRSARQINPLDVGWVVNAAGYHFHNDFGAGMVDAQAAVDLAQGWVNLGTQVSAQSALAGLALPLPENDPVGVTVQFTITDSTLRAEQVTVNLDVVHTFRGDIDVELTSPSGTVSKLLTPRLSDNAPNYSNYRVMTVRNWGERAVGTWTLRVSDRQAQDLGSLTGARLTVYGSAALPAVPGFQVNDVSVVEGNTGTTNAVFTVGLLPAATVPVTVDYFTAGLTASAGSDFVSTNGVLTFAPGVTNQTITVAVNGDLAIEPRETFQVVLSNPTGGAILADSTGVGSILDDDLGVVADLIVTPTTNTGQLVSSLLGTNGGLIVRSVQLSAHSTPNASSVGTYQLVGASPHTYGLTLPGIVLSSGNVDDYETGPDNQPGNTTAYSVPATSNQELLLDTITGGVWDHNDVTQLDIHFDVATGSNNVVFQVVFGSEEYPDYVGTAYIDGFGIFLNGTNIAFESGLPVNINHPSFLAQIGTELNGVMAPGGNPVMTFSALVAPNSTNNVLTFILADTSDDILDTTVYISSLAAVPTPPVPVATISDALPVVEGNDSTNVVFNVSLSTVSTQQVSVVYFAANGGAKRGADFVNTAGTLIFPPGVTNSTITVPIIGDLIDEPDEGFSVVIYNPTNAVIGRSQAFTTIIDDDPQAALISISDAVVTEGDAGTVDLAFYVLLSEPSGHVVTVNYGTAPGTASVGLDYLPRAGILAFEPGETSKIVTVKVVGDTVYEPSETFFLNLSSAKFAMIEDGQGQATITDNDPLPTLSVADVSVTEGDAGTTAMVFTVKLSNPTQAEVTVEYFTTDGTATLADSDYASKTGTLVFESGQMQATITVDVEGDLTVEANETLTFNLTNPVNAGAGDMQATGTILNDDGPHLSITGARVNEGAVGTITNAVFLVTLSKSDGNTVLVDYEVLESSATANVDYVPVTGTLSFPDGTITQEITVVVNGDDLMETNETFTVHLKNVVNGTIAVADAQGVIVDDDTIANLALGLSLPVTNIYVGHPFTISLAVTNQGTFGATNVSVVQVLPAGFELLSSGFSRGTGVVSQVGDTVSAAIPVLTNGQWAAVSLEVVGSIAGQQAFAASVSSDQFDDDLADNEASLDKELLDPIVTIEKAGSMLIAESLVPANRGIDPGETVTVSFALKNTGTIAPANLMAILRSESGITTGEPAKSYGAVVAGGPSVAREFVFSATGLGGSTVTAVFDLYDLTATGSNSLGTVSFAFQLGETITVTSSEPITIPAIGPAAVYPAVANVSGLIGRVAKVTVRINGLTHGFPDDLDILLVAPGGEGVILMSDAGGSVDLAGVNLVFDDAAETGLPDSAKINAGTYKPTNFGTGDVFSGAPAGPYGTALASFVGLIPNGAWQLYIVDDGSGDSGSITGWSLSIETTIPADLVAELAVSGVSTPNPAYVGQNFTYSITVTNMGPDTANNLRLISTLANGVSLVTSTPAASATDGNELTFSLGTLAAGSSTVVTIQAVSSAAGTPTNFVSVAADEIDLQSQNSSVAIGTRINRVTTLATAGEVTPGGPFSLSLAGQPGLSYVIEVSTNLINWVPVYTNTTLDGVLNFTDTGATGAGLRFYRAVER